MADAITAKELSEAMVGKRLALGKLKSAILDTTEKQEAVAALASNGGIALLASGANLTNADATVNPGTDAVSAYTMPATTLTEGRVVTLGVTGTLVAGVTTVWIQCRDITTNTLTIRNGGTNGTAIADVVIPANRGKPMVVGCTYDGADWIPHTLDFVT